MKDKQILFIIHRLYSNNLAKKGGIDRILEFLAQKNKITTIEHPFEKINHPSTLTLRSYSKAHKTFTKPPILWLEECVINIIWILQTKKKYTFAVASDPLNFFSCYLLKKLRLTQLTQFHSTDYSQPRFNNPFLEWIYQFLYIFALTHADKTTLVSQRMINQAKKMVLPIFHQRFFLLPNSPEYSRIPKYSLVEKDHNALVMTAGIFKDQVDMNMLIAALTQLKMRWPKIVLYIIGVVEKEYIDMFIKSGLKNNLAFVGGLPYQQSIERVAKSYIGITCYKKTSSYMSYADSLKIREYAAAGLPIVCDSIYGTAQEVRQYDAGFVYNTAHEMATSVHQLMSNKKLYQIKSKHALSWAKKMDKRKLLAELYGNIV